PEDQSAIWLELAHLGDVHPTATSVSPALDEDSPLYLTSDLLVNAADNEDDDEEEKEPPTTAGAFDEVLNRDTSSLLTITHAIVHACGQRGSKERLAAISSRWASQSDVARDAAVCKVRAAEARDGDLELLKSALAQQPNYLGAMYILRDHALRAEDWSSALQAVEAEAEASLVPKHRLEAFLLAGELAAEQLGDSERALANLGAAIKLDPKQRGAFEQRSDLLEAAERWEDLAETLRAQILVETDTDLLQKIHRRLGDLARVHLKDREGAKEQLRAVLEFAPEDKKALETLAELYETDKMWSDAATTWIRLARLEKSQERLRDLLLRLGRIYQDEEHDRTRGIISLTKVLTLDEDNREALQRLSDLYLENLDFNEALEVTTRLHNLEEDPQRKVDHLLRIAKVQEDGLKNAHEAARAFRQALETVPSDLKAIGALCGFYARQGDQRSVMIHLDSSVATMAQRLERDPFETFAYRGLFRIFGWRKQPDACLCAAQALEALGDSGKDEREFRQAHIGGIGEPGSSLGV
ncbi:MAG: hypothetical protein KAI47_07990, partial [Deltaproteobacteria bacterium]|nr:hypothetical protein [Deltaproteobacteria bacterium]